MIRDREKNFVSAVVYVRNDQEQIKGFLAKLMGVLSENFEKYEIICVDDQSQDGSVRAIKDMSGDFDSTVVSIISMGYYQGRELSMNAGVDLSIGDFVFEFDSVIMDYDPSLIMQVYRHSLKEGFDIVSAAPKRVSRRSARLFYSFFNKFAKYHMVLRPETFRILSRRSINRVHSLMVSIPYRKAVYARCGLRVDTIQYMPTIARHKVRDRAVASYKSGLALDTIVLFTDIPGWFVNIMIFGSLFAVIFFACYMLYAVYGAGQGVRLWMVASLIVSIALCGLFTCTAIIIKYLSLIEGLIFKRQKYVIESIEKIAK